MEFDVLNGESIIDAIRQLRWGGLKKVYGFDSFGGLPKHNNNDSESSELAPSFFEGNYKGLSCQEVQRSVMLSSRIPQEDLILTPGFFNESLPKFNKDSLAEAGFPLVFYIDCDLYSSTVDVLDFITSLVEDGTWILADDFWCYRGSPKHGQRRAIQEWVDKNPNISLSPYASFRGFGRAFIVNKV